MKLEGQARLLRIFIGENDRWHGKPLYEAIVELARTKHLAGATVLRGIEGFGAKSRIHTDRILRLSEDLPIVIEIVDAVEKIEAVLPSLSDMIGDGMLTIEDVHVVQYRARQQP